MAHAKKNKTKPAQNVTADKAKSPAQAVSKTVDAAANAAAHNNNNIAQAATQQTENLAKAAAPRLSAIESQVATSDQMVHASSAAVKDFIANGTQEAKKTQEKVMSMSRDGMENWNKTADQTARSLAEAFNASKEQLDAVLESSKITSELARELQEKFIADYNELYAENVALSKDLLECRTLNDLAQLQNRALQSTLSHWFDNGTRLSEAWFRIATEACEPLQQQASQASGRINKTFAA